MTVCYRKRTGDSATGKGRGKERVPGQLRQKNMVEVLETATSEIRLSDRSRQGAREKFFPPKCVRDPRRPNMMTRGAITNLVNRYRAVLKKCRLVNLFGTLAVTGMLVMGGAGMAEAAITAAFMNSSTESIDYTGAVDIGVYSAGTT